MTVNARWAAPLAVAPVVPGVPKRKRLKRGSYRTAVEWIALNDDTEWVDGNPDSGDGTPSVTACLVADLFAVTVERVRKDLKRKLKGGE